jgi:hypothetical protein
MNSAISALPEIFHHWQVGPVAGEVDSFGTGITGASTQPAVWSIDLPGETEDAREIMQMADTDVQVMDQVVHQLPDRFDALLKDSIEPSFGTTSEEQAMAQLELQRWLGAFDPQAMSFGFAGISAADIRESAQGLQQALQELTLQVQYLAWVETRSEGALLARSVVDWGGSTTTGFNTLSVEKIDLHRQSLQVALTSRFVLLNLVLSVIKGAGKIAMLIAAPGGALLALPAAWRIANRYLSDAAQNRQ